MTSPSDHKLDTESADAEQWLTSPGRGVTLALFLAAIGLAMTMTLAAWLGAGGGTTTETVRPEASPIITAWRVLVALTVIGLLAQAFGAIALRLRQPRVIGEIIAGLSFGPSALGAIFPSETRVLLSPETLEYITIIGTVSLTLYMFAVGTELDHKTLKNHGIAVVPVSLALVTIPLAVGFMIALPWFDIMAGSASSQLTYCLFMGTAMSITAFPVLARIVDESGLTHTRLGKFAMLTAAGSDVFAWCALAVPLALVHAESMGGVSQSLILTIALVTFLLGAIRPLLAKLSRQLSRFRPLVAVTLAGILALVFSLAAATESLGVHAIFGGFLAGVVLPRDEVHVSDIPERLDSLNRSLLLPVYFVSVGLQVDLAQLVGDNRLIVGGTVLLIGAVATKFLTAAILGKTMGMGGREASGFGVLMNTRGVTEIVVLGAGLSSQIINVGGFTAMVVMAILTTLMAGPLLSCLGLSRAGASRQPTRPPIVGPSKIRPCARPSSAVPPARQSTPVIKHDSHPPPKTRRVP
jgi:Kef-type K+ transport system membrane component KefB